MSRSRLLQSTGSNHRYCRMMLMGWLYVLRHYELRFRYAAALPRLPVGMSLRQGYQGDQNRTTLHERSISPGPSGRRTPPASRTPRPRRWPGAGEKRRAPRRGKDIRLSCAPTLRSGQPCRVGGSTAAFPVAGGGGGGWGGKVMAGSPARMPPTARRGQGSPASARALDPGASRLPAASAGLACPSSTRRHRTESLPAKAITHAPACRAFSIRAGGSTTS